MTNEELIQQLQELQNKYEHLELKYLKLREWSDNNDLYLREMVDALSESVEKNFDRFTNVFARLKELENTVFKG